MMNLRSLEAPVTGRDGSEDATAGELVASAESLEEDVIGADPARGMQPGGVGVCG